MDKDRYPDADAPSQGDLDKMLRTGGTFNEGDSIGKRYKVLKRLGRGGMGMVYLVRDRKTEQVVALKTVLPQHAQRHAAIKRFEREVNASKKLDHPGIVKIIDAWRLDDMLMYTMEYVEGESLYIYMKRRVQLGLGSTVRILCLLCHALEHAHRFTIHRDISPDNVMLTKDGKVKLLDFGLAKITDGASAFTMVGTNLGKMQYNAPEQQLNARDVDHRADLYSLGVMFYEMLSGQLPGAAKGKKLTELRPDLPRTCDGFFAQAAAADPEHRFQSARAMREALTRLYQDYKGEELPAITAAPNPEGPPPSLQGRPSFCQRAMAFVRRLNPVSRR